MLPPQSLILSSKCTKTGLQSELQQGSRIGGLTALSQAPNYRKRKEMERGGVGKKKRNKTEGKKEMKGEDEKEGSRGVIPLVSFQSNRWFAVGLV